MALEMMTLVNAGIGIVRTGQAEVDKTKASMTKKFEELVAKGASDSSESSVRLRDLATKIVDSVVQTNTTIEKNWTDIRSKFSESFQRISSKEGAIPQQKMEKKKP
ncbi:hypothetical protein EHO61_16335 [Leptospira fluminis]|uniref:Chemotaxis protein n=1 Tax=Leptospira fluminis TaxID=2484979 RepID=A0A4R9GL57_9LEPT|nr:hypothetical protein [Leptospira fluminis]TGK15248.1 hypothetical protein EHO61_16335 [Leptospira fluminis]